MKDTLDLEIRSISFPREDLKLITEIVKKFGWKMSPKKKSGLEESLEDIRKGRISKPYTSVDELFKELGANVCDSDYKEV